MTVHECRWSVESKAPGGHVLADKKCEGYYITMSFVDPERRGQGLGKQLYRNLFSHGAKHGLRVHSDDHVSNSATGVWESLKKEGHDIRKHPAARQTSGSLGGTGWSTYGDPVYTYYPPKKA